jgi:hypothetical protein
VTTVRLRWHEQVPADIAAVRRWYGPDAVTEARRLVASLPGDPLQGDWLTVDGRTGDLSTCRKVAFGPDEIDAAGRRRGPALRLVYRLLPSNTDLQQVEVLAIGRRRDLEAYALAAGRLEEAP